ncbi:hypothetical protein AVEN_67228-1 [Araneus ventricosus]|uniref:Uncharacterized protein n=1 Tax=Araneus ventricosus TaxID=182803 RepID=A0A4Y2E5Y5_ARAVE|nr:hypothetical protein AVEN_37211-1 [Araneus ventricosus]GBM23438.1 hypothetical protein AVEN_67228-1 [Araneus ventricosus]
MPFSIKDVYIERSLTLSDLRDFNKKCLVKLEDMECIKNRIVKDFIDQLHLPLILPAHMEPTEFQDVLMRMKRRIEINFIEFKQLVVAHGVCVQKLRDLLIVYDESSTIMWWHHVNECEQLKPSLEERLSELISAINQAKNDLFL